MRRAPAQSPLRVLHCPTMVGGHPPMLARAERELGLDSRAVVFHMLQGRYPADEILFDGVSRPRRELRRWGLLRRALAECDVVHFNFGSSIMPRSLPRSVVEGDGVLHTAYRAYARAFELRDLAWLKRAGKIVFVTYQGDDARQDGFSRRRFAISQAIEREHVGGEAGDRAKQRAIGAFERHADRIYALNPDVLHVLPPRAEFLPYAHVDVREWRALPQRETPDVPVVLHAPTDRPTKGTRFILEALERLRAEGVRFEFVLVENVSQAEGRRLYERADLLVDQVLVGWYGGLAVELMALGTPVMAYIREEDLAFVPEPMRRELPVISVTPESLYADLRSWLTDRRVELRERGAAGRAYVERWHDCLAVASRVKRDYEAAVAARAAS